MGILTMLGALLFLVGWIWIVVIAFKTNGVVWGLITFLLLGLGCLIFCIVKKQGWMQFGIMILGWVLMFIGGGMSFTMGAG